MPETSPSPESAQEPSKKKPETPEEKAQRERVVKAADDATETMTPEELRARVVKLAFDNDEERYSAFLKAVRAVVPDEASVILRGSAVTGVRWKDGKPFDFDGPGTSDLDLTFVGGDMQRHWKPDGFYIPLLHTIPLSDKAPDVCPPLVPLRKQLCEIARRPVNLQATTSLVQFGRDVMFEQPYFTILESSTDAAEIAEEQESSDRTDRAD